jgi:hypothetical protein
MSRIPPSLTTASFPIHASACAARCAIAEIETRRIVEAAADPPRLVDWRRDMPAAWASRHRGRLNRTVTADM